MLARFEVDALIFKQSEFTRFKQKFDFSQQKVVDTLQKKKPEIRAFNRAGQSLIRQLDDSEDVEAELDKLSDSYYDLVDKAKDKLKETKETVKKVKQFVEIIEVIEIWITEIIEIVEKFEVVGNEPDAIKKQLKEVEDMQIGVAKHTLKVKVI